MGASELTKFFKGTATNKPWTVSDITDTTKLTGPLPVSVVGVGGTAIGAATTATLTNVADQATNITVLAANTARLGAAIYNDSTSTLYLKYGATATTSSFTVKMYPDDYHEVFGGYTGIIDGIWDVNASGSARVTELT